MTFPGNCPYCTKSIMGVRIHAVDATSTGYSLGEGWKAVTYACQSCSKVLGVQIDPIAVKADIVREVTEELFKLSKSRQLKGA